MTAPGRNGTALVIGEALVDVILNPGEPPRDIPGGSGCDGAAHQDSHPGQRRRKRRLAHPAGQPEPPELTAAGGRQARLTSPEFRYGFDSSQARQTVRWRRF